MAKLTKLQLLQIEKYMDGLVKVGLSQKTRDEVKSKIDDLYPDAPEINTN